MQENEDGESERQKPSTQESINSISAAWESVAEMVIAKSFLCCGISNALETATFERAFRKSIILDEKGISDEERTIMWPTSSENSAKKSPLWEFRRSSWVSTQYSTSTQHSS